MDEASKICYFQVGVQRVSLPYTGESSHEPIIITVAFNRNVGIREARKCISEVATAIRTSRGGIVYIPQPELIS